MSQQNLIIYQFTSFYKIFKEIEKELNFNIIEATDEKSLKVITRDLKDFIIITKKNSLNISNQLIVDKSPINISKVIEKINLELLRRKFNYQSQIKVKNYLIDLNARQIIFENKKLKLTEKEVNTIIYLSKAQNPISPMELQKNVWGYQSNLETHTVETHIYRLRKKFLDIFDDNSFILSINNGYKIK
jgi:hypothetical protein